MSFSYRGASLHYLEERNNIREEEISAVQIYSGEGNFVEYISWPSCETSSAP